MPTIRTLLAGLIAGLSIACLGIAQHSTLPDLAGDYVLTWNGDPVEDGVTWRIHWMYVGSPDLGFYLGFQSRDEGEGPVPRKDIHGYYIAIPDTAGYAFHSLGDDPDLMSSGKLVGNGNGFDMINDTGPWEGHTLELTPE
ncbi:MAG: hypothetical protein KF830_15675 [Planctomycetes bacterium]|nr:hypothetical protein [Planctomycetota bacterium]